MQRTKMAVVYEGWERYTRSGPVYVRSVALSPLCAGFSDGGLRALSQPSQDSWEVLRRAPNIAGYSDYWTPRDRLSVGPTIGAPAMSLDTRLQIGVPHDLPRRGVQCGGDLDLGRT